MSESGPYLQLEDGARFEIDMEKSELLRLACCDCGLVHEIAFAIEENGKLGIAMKRNARATAAKRRSQKPNTKGVCSVCGQALSGGVPCRGGFKVESDAGETRGEVGEK